MAIENKAKAQAVLVKLKSKATVSDEELKQLQQHVDILEQAAEESHHDHDHPTLE
jgi:hypothetical protein